MKSFLKARYWIEEAGNALVESALLFPVFLSLLMGVYDLGQGIIVNQKTITASQVIADLVARNKTIDMATIDDIIVAAEMAIEPYDTEPFGYDIASLQFDEDGDYTVLWRVTENMDPNDAALETTEILELTDDGLVVVTTAFEYTPYFAEFVTDTIEMQEVSFLHGRKTSVINCTDCL